MRIFSVLLVLIPVIIAGCGSDEKNNGTSENRYANCDNVTGTVRNISGVKIGVFRNVSGDLNLVDGNFLIHPVKDMIPVETIEIVNNTYKYTFSTPMDSTDTLLAWVDDDGDGKINIKDTAYAPVKLIDGENRSVCNFSPQTYESNTYYAIVYNMNGKRSSVILPDCGTEDFNFDNPQ